ncbi:DUF2264 domain-containing protein [Cerasicoccus fimbriatus]|uniref:DUF2264 domain-containing protein n=1 Tax=Cerasicoccus fimbriatus TaxID=3014554 RepID=UPI0022B5C71F|nr:DUF2264 domain-containing protein [Cerasicoccus sp. TK19100]
MIAQPETTTRSQWLTDAALKLLRPLMGVIEPTEAKLALHGRASDHDARADRLESFARPFHLYALLLGHLGNDMPEEAASWHRDLAQCLDNGTNPQHPAYWGPSTNFHQHVVEMGLLVLSLEICREHFWEQLPSAVQQRALDWLETARSVAMHWNNHLFFGVFTLEFLIREGRGTACDRALIDGWLRELETMSRDEGWFRDGLNDSADYYNAYAFHYYGLNWVRFFCNDPQSTRAEFWTSRAEQFLQGFHHVFASDGGAPNFGRSQTYRFALLAPFGPALALERCPIPAATVRRLASDHLSFFLEKEIFTPEGWLNIGWTDENPAIAESYSCVSSSYWAAKGFSLLLLPPEHAFWAAEPASAEVTYADEHSHATSVGLTIRRFSGDTEIINTGSAVSLMNLRYFASKWSKLAYRASAGTILPDAENPFPADMSLVAEFDGKRFGRHITYPTEFGENYVRCTYTLGEKTHDNMAAVETFIAWKDRWLFVEHTVTATAPCKLHQGGFSLGLYKANEVQKDEPLSGCIGLSANGRVSLIQSICGYEQSMVSASAAEDPRRHTLQRHHAVPVLSTLASTGKIQLSCLIYFGPTGEPSLPWIIDSNRHELCLAHPFYDDWSPRNV